MKAWIKYRLLKLLVLIVALNTLDVSVDIDHLTNSIGWFDVERFDDIDSISEFLIESIFHDDNLVKEGKTDDRPHSRNNIRLFTLLVFSAEHIKDWNVNPTSQPLNNFRPALSNTRFHFEDHSDPDYNPPDNNQPRI